MVRDKTTSAKKNRYKNIKLPYQRRAIIDVVTRQKVFRTRQTKSFYVVTPCLVAGNNSRRLGIALVILNRA